MADDSQLETLLIDYAGACAQRPGLSIAEFCTQRGCVEQVTLLAERWAQLQRPAATESPATEDLAVPVQPSSPPAVSKLPSAVGRYVLMGEISRGGMGVVYRAFDPSFGRDVAIKLIHEHYARRPAAARRFIDEAQITGKLQHPGIPPVHELGTLPDGRPFLAMKLIQGRTLAALIDDAFSEQTPTAAEHSRLLVIFESICQSVAYAHSRGVIHRDLKPLNIMVGEFGEVQVMDWGLAKPLGALQPAPGSIGTEADASLGTDLENTEEATLQVAYGGSGPRHLTSPGAVLGTPAYMPPEQASADATAVDRQADVFGLGAILCCVLTGEPPYAGGSPETIRLRAMRGELAEAFARLEGTGADPAVISLCKRCLARAKEDRPRDAGEVAAAMAAIRTQAEERGRQAEAERLAALARADEQRKRRRTVQWAAGLVTVILAAGLAVSLWQLDRANFAEQQAVTARNEKERQRQQAADAALAEKQARIEAERQRHFAEGIAQFVQDDFLALSSVDGQFRFGGDSGGLGKDANLKQLLDRAAAKLEQRQDLEPRIRAQLCWIIGVSFRYHDDFPRAIAFLEECVELRKQCLGPDDPDTLAAQNSLALAYESARRLPEAIQLMVATLHAEEKVLGADHRSTLITRRNLGLAYLDAGRFPQALAVLEEVRTAQEKRFGPTDTETLRTLVSIAQVYRAMGRFPEAIQLLERVGDAQAKMLPADHPELLATLRDLAAAYRATGRLPKAIELFERVVAAQTRTLGPDHMGTLTTLNSLALAYAAAGRMPEALKLFEQLRDALVRKLGAEHPEALTTQANLAWAYQAVGRVAEAISLLEKIHALETRSLGAEHPSTLATLGNLAKAMHSAGRTAEAIVLLEQVHQAQIKKLGADHPDTLVTQALLATAYRSAGRFSESIHLCEQTLAATERKMGSDHPHTITAVANLAVALRAAGRLPQAVPLFDRAAHALAKRQFQHEHAAGIITSTYQALEDAKMWPEAEVWRRRWLPVAKQRLGAEHPAFASELAGLGYNLIQQKKFSEAEEFLRTCLAIRQQHASNDWRTFEAAVLLGRALFGRSQLTEDRAEKEKFLTEAETHLLAGYAGLKERWVPPQAHGNDPKASNPTTRLNSGPPQARMLEACNRLIDLYTAWGKSDEQKKWQAEKEHWK